MGETTTFQTNERRKKGASCGIFGQRSVQDSPGGSVEFCPQNMPIKSKNPRCIYIHAIMLAWIGFSCYIIGVTVEEEESLLAGLKKRGIYLMPRKKAPTQIAPMVNTPELLKHNNQRLFSDYFLNTTIASEEWRHQVGWSALLEEARPVMAKLQERYKTFGPIAARTKEAQTEKDWIRPILADLGHTFEVQATLKMPAQASSQYPDYVFYATEEQRLAQVGHVLDDRVSQAGALAVGDAKEWDLPLDQMKRGASDSFSNKNPSFQIFFYMLHSKLPWGILTNGRKWRLYHQDTAYKLDVYYEVDLPDLLASDDVEHFLYFYLFFRRTAFTPTNPASLENILKEIVKSSKEIRKDLKAQVYEALHLVAQGFLSYADNKLEPTPENCQRIYEHSLILLYRLLFILYAESRDLLPTENTTYEQKYSLHAIADQIRQDLAQHNAFFPHSAVLWHQLKILFRSIDMGEVLLGVSTFDGGLFNPQNHHFLETYTAGDLYLAQAIDKLARRPQDALDFSEESFIDYRDLSERHLGTIYEGLLEHTLKVAGELMAELRSNNLIVPLSKANHRDILRTIQPGEVYLVTEKGERKVTGSYYTPDYIVKYMVEQTIKPVLDAAVAHATDDEEKIAAVLAINVLDPAMGSGHFPVEVVEYISRYLVELGVKTDDKDPQEADMVYWKRRVAQHCIYGVDLNPLAVELAKLSLWLATAAKGYPLNFLDHHLRAGNALIGSSLEEVEGSHPKKKAAAKRAASLLDLAEDGESAEQFSMLDDPEFGKDLKAALNIVQQIIGSSGKTISEVKAQEAAYEAMRAAFVSRYKDILDLGGAVFYDGIDIAYHLWGAYASYAARIFTVQESGPFELMFEQVFRKVRQIGENKRFFHWELEFPDIFFNEDGTPRSEQAGFDAIIGNPPYVRQEKLGPDKRFYEDHYDVYHGSADLFIYFFGQGMRLLRPGGRLAYITSNSWLRANYAEPLRRFLRQSTQVEQIIDLGNTRVFEDAPDLSPSIQVARKAKPDQQHAKVAVFSRADRISEFAEKLNERFFRVTIHDQPDEGWQLRTDASRKLFRKLVASGKPLGKVVDGMHYGIKTGFNEAFFVDSDTRKRLILADPVSEQIIKPFVRGEDLRPWYQEDEGRWLIFTRHGVDIDAYPAIKAHLEQFKDRLEPRPKDLAGNVPWTGRKAGAYKWYEIQDTIEYHEEFSKPKIFYPDIANYPRFSFDVQGTITNNKGYIIPTEDLSLLGILQSRVIWFCISHLCAPLGERSFLIIYQHFTQYIERLPIPSLTDEQRKHIGSLAKQLTAVAQKRYQVRHNTGQTIKSDLGAGQSKVTDKLDEWWKLDWQGFQNEMRKSFKREIPLKKQGEWREYFTEEQNKITQFTAEIIRLEKELNKAVYDVYGLNDEEIALVEQETKYQYGEW